MGLKERVLNRLKRAMAKFSGEYSEPAPEEMEAYQRPGKPNENAEVVMARLNRPKAAPKKPD